MKYFSKLSTIFILGIFLVALPLGVFAGSEQFKKTVYVGPDEIIDGNFIKVGSVIEINGAVNGDVIVAGNSITITGPVAGDVIAAGNAIRIKGPVLGSVRVAGSTVEIDGEVAHNVWVVGSNVSLSETSRVGWDVFGAGATIDAAGPIGGNLWVAGASVVVSDEVGKNVNVKLDDEGQLILNPTAKVAGNVGYESKSADQLIVRAGATVAGETAQQNVEMQQAFAIGQALTAGYIFIKVISFFSLLIIGLVMVSLMPKIMVRIHDFMVTRPLPALGWGGVIAILTPVAAFLLMLTVIGIPLGLMLIPLYLISLYMSIAIAGFTVGLLILNNVSQGKKYKGSLVWALVLGLVVVVIVTAIPVIGWIIKPFLMLWALGGIFTIKRELWKEFR